MPTSSPRDALTYPIAAALWAAGAALGLSLVNAVLAFRQLVGDGGVSDLVLDLLPIQIGQSLLGASVVATLTLVVAERRQARSPERVGHAPGAAAATGLLAALLAWAAVSAVGGGLYSHFAVLQSPAGFAGVGIAMSLLHAGVAMLGAAIGAALLPQPGAAAPPASPAGQARAGVLVYGVTLAFALEQGLAVVGGVLHQHGGAPMLAISGWAALLALAIGAATAAGYALRRGRATLPLRWGSDAWAALATLPLALVLAAALGLAGLLFFYVVGDVSTPALVAVGLVILALAALAFAGIGAVAGMLRMRAARPTP